MNFFFLGLAAFLPRTLAVELGMDHSVLSTFSWCLG